MKGFFKTLRSFFTWPRDRASQHRRRHSKPIRKQFVLESLEDRTLPSVTIGPVAQPPAQNWAVQQPALAAPIHSTVDQVAQKVASDITNAAVTISKVEVQNNQLVALAGTLLAQGSPAIAFSAPVTVQSGPAVAAPDMAVLVLSPVHLQIGTAQINLDRIVLNVPVDSVLNTLVALGKQGESYLPGLEQSAGQLLSVGNALVNAYDPSLEPMLTQIFQNLDANEARGLQLAQGKLELLALEGLSFNVHIGGLVPADIAVNIAPETLARAFLELGLIPNLPAFPSFNFDAYGLFFNGLNFPGLNFPFGFDPNGLNGELALENDLLSIADQIYASKSIPAPSGPLSAAFQSEVPVLGGGGGGRAPALPSGDGDEAGSPYQHKRIVADPYKFDQSSPPPITIDGANPDDPSSGANPDDPASADASDALARVLAYPQQSLRQDKGSLKSVVALPGNSSHSPEPEPVLAHREEAPAMVSPARIERLDREEAMEELGNEKFVSAAIWASLAWPIPQQIQEAIAGSRPNPTKLRQRDRNTTPVA